MAVLRHGKIYSNVAGLVLCNSYSESANHLLMKCPFLQKIWNLCCSELNLQLVWDGLDFGTGMLNWVRNYNKPLFLPIFISWIIWFTRNEVIFQNLKPDAVQCVKSVCYLLQNYPEEEHGKKVVSEGTFSFAVSQPVLFFDGAAQDGLCATGRVIYINDHHHFSLRLNGGRGTNMKAEILALWVVLKVANSFGLVNPIVFGDSRVTIKWANNEYSLNVLELENWCALIRQEITKLEQISFNHIYRSHNTLADQLSKEAFAGPVGVLFWEEWMEACLIDRGNLYIF